MAMVALQSTTEEAKRGRGRPRTANEVVMAANEKVTCNVSTMAESHKRKRETFADFFANDEVKYDVMMRAKQIQASLGPEFPSLIKYMLHSHVAGGFCMHLSTKFCDEYLSKEDIMVDLEDEDGRSYQTKYLVRKAGLSGGWRSFSINHNLKEGDVVIFHLVKPTKFKVYIVRATGSENVDGALCLPKSEACAKQTNPIDDAGRIENLGKLKEEMKDQGLEHASLDNLDDIEKENMVCATNHGPVLDDLEIERRDFGFEITDGIRISESAIDFKDVKSFDDFDIIVNGLVINSELSKGLQIKYYELCCSQKSFLHDHLLEGLNCKLVAGVLAEVINIADAVRASKLTTSHDNLATWEKALRSFKGLGMNVDFLLARLGQLMSLSTKSKRYKEARIERVNAEGEMRAMQAKLLEIKGTMNRLDVEIETLEMDSENPEHMFQEVAKAPW